MKIDFHNEREVVIAEFEGSLDTTTSPEAEVELNKVVDDGAKKLIIDFGKLDFISSSGLRILLGLAKRQMKDGGELRLAGMNDTVREVFAISGFDTIIKSVDTVADAMKDLA